MHTPWNPRLFLIPEDELVDELCLAAIIYRTDPEEGVIGYDDSTIRQVTAEVTWHIFNTLHGGDHSGIPIIIN